MSKIRFRCPACDALLHVTTDVVSMGHDPEFLSRRVDEINWGRGYNARIATTLKNQSIETMADLIKLDEHDLLMMPNFGRRSLDQVNRILRSQDMVLNQDPDYWSKRFNIKKETQT